MISWTPIRRLTLPSMQYRPPERLNWYDIDPRIPENNPYKVIDRAEQRITAAGKEVPKKKNVGNLLLSALNYVGNAPLSVVTNPLYNVLDYDKTNDDLGSLGKSMIDALAGKRFTSTTDLFDLGGWRNDPSKKWYEGSNLARNILGFVGDVGLDPTTYVSFGATSLGKLGGKAAAKAGVKSVAKKASSSIADDVLTNIASKVGRSTDDLLKMAARHGDDADLVLGLAKASYRNPDDALRILDRGVDSLNKDVLNRAGQLAREEKLSLSERLKGILEGTDNSQGLKMTRGKVFGSDLNKALDRLDDTEQIGISKRIMDILGDENAVKNYNMLKDIEKKQGLKLTVEQRFKTVVDDKDLDIIETVSKALGGDLNKAWESIDTFMTRGKSASMKDRLTKLLGEFEETSKGLKKIDDEIKIVGELTAAYDKATKHVYFKFAGKDVLDITPLTKQFKITGEKTATGAYKGLANKIALGDGLIGRAFRAVTDKVAPIFNPRYIGYDLMKNRPQAYALAEQIAEEISKYSRYETALPKEALRGAAYLFADMPEFLTNQTLRHAAIFRVESGIDEASTALWKYISKQPLDNKGLEYINSLAKRNPEQYRVIETLRNTIGEKELQLLDEVAAQVYKFNSAVYHTLDKKYGITFGKEAGEEAENLLTEEQLQTYVRHYYEKEKKHLPHLTKKERVSARFGTYMGAYDKRKFTSIARQLVDAPELVPKNDLIASMALRHYESLRVRQNKLFQQSFKEAIEQKIPGIEHVVAHTKTHDTPHYIESLGYYVSDEVYNQFKRLPEFMREAKDGNWWVDVYDGMTNVLKMTQTSLNPAFIIRNAIGETSLNVVFAGVKGRSHKLAADIMQDLKDREISIVGDTIFHKGKEFIRTIDGVTQMHDGTKWVDVGTGLDIEDFVTQKLKDMGFKTYNIGGKEFTALSLIQEFERQGLGWSGISRGNLAQNMQKTLNKEVLRTKRKGVGRLANMYLDAGDTIETWTRLAHFVDRLERGYGIEEAAADVRKFHVDYRDLTPTERNVFRRIAPYYTYMRKNLPIQIRLLATQPGRANMLFHLVNNSYRAIEESSGEPLRVPEYLRNGLAIPIDVDNEGNVLYLNWNLPLSDLSRIQYGLQDLVRENILTMLHPAIKVPFEWESNTRLGMDDVYIEKFEGERAPLIPNWQGSPLGLPKKADNIVQQFGVVNTARQGLGTVISTLMNETPEPTKPRQIPMLQSILPVKNNMGVRNSEAYERRDELLDYIQRLKQQGVYVPNYNELRQRRQRYFTP